VYSVCSVGEIRHAHSVDANRPELQISNRREQKGIEATERNRNVHHGEPSAGLGPTRGNGVSSQKPVRPSECFALLTPDPLSSLLPFSTDAGGEGGRSPDEGASTPTQPPSHQKADNTREKIQTRDKHRPEIQIPQPPNPVTIFHNSKQRRRSRNSQLTYDSMGKTRSSICSHQSRHLIVTFAAWCCQKIMRWEHITMLRVKRLKTHSYHTPRDGKKTVVMLL